MEYDDFELGALINAIGELARRSLGTLVPVFFAIFALGFAVDYFFGDAIWAGVVVGIGQFVIGYFFAKELARDAGLLAPGAIGPGFGAYFGVSFLVGLGTGIGYLLLIIPGIFLQIRWMFAFPILFSPEDNAQGTDSIARSWAMTGKVFWKLLAGWVMGLIFTAIAFYAYIYWAFVPDQPTHLLGLAVANAATAASAVYALLLGFAAFLLSRNDRAELERIFA